MLVCLCYEIIIIGVWGMEDIIRKYRNNGIGYQEAFDKIANHLGNIGVDNEAICNQVALDILNSFVDK